MDLTISGIGFVVGVMVGMTGVGGASLMTPILIYLGISPVKAIGTDLVYNAITKLFGSVQHLRQHTVRPDIVFYLGVGSIPGAILATMFMKWLDLHVAQTDFLFEKVLGAILLATALLNVIQEIKSSGNTGNQVHQWRKKSEQRKKMITTLTGLFLGFLVGLTSVGSGSLFALVLYNLYTLSGKELVGTDIVHAFLLTTTASFFYVHFGLVDYLLVLQLLVGSVPGVMAGSSLATKVPSTFLRYIVFIVIMASGLMLLLR